MRRFLTILAIIIPFVSALAQTQSHNIIIDESSLTPVQKDAISGVTIDKIGVDRSRRACARIKMHINRMTRTEIEGLTVQQIGGVIDVMKQIVATDGSGLIIELTAKEPTRFYLHHDKYGDSNEVSLNLEGNKEYKLSAELNMTYSIVVSSNTKGAEIYIDNSYHGRIDDSYACTINDINPGTHTLKVQNGAAISEQTIEVSSSSIYFRADLNTHTAKPQYVVFKVIPKDASILIDQKPQVADSEGCVTLRLFNGSYNYQVSAKNYHTEKGTFIVNGAKVVKDVELKPAFGWLNIESSSSLKGASVYIDDSYLGQVPIKNVQLSSGEHRIKVVQNLYFPYESTVIIKDNETLKFTPKLDANFTTVTLTTENGAEIYVNDRFVGQSSWTGDLEAGLYVFEARKEGHRPTTLSQNIVVKSQKQNITIDAPTPINGTIDITSSPSMAIVYIDDQEIGETPLMTDLLIGNHTIRVSKKGYKSYTKSIYIREGATESIDARLIEGTDTSSVAHSSQKTQNTQKTTTIAKSASNPTEKAVNISATNSYSKPAKTNYNYGSYYLGYSKVSTSCNYSELEDIFLFDTGLTFGGKIRSQMGSKLYLNYGFNISYISGSYSESWDGEMYEVSQSLFSMNLPVSISYLIKLGDITFAPYCGINLRYNLLGTEDDTYESYDGENESYSWDLFDDYDMDGCPFSRQQVGLNCGVDIEFDNYVIGISFLGDLTPIYENTDYDVVSATFSMTTFSIGFKF